VDKFLRRKFLRLIDEFLPEYDARKIHRTQVHAPDSRIYCAFRTADLEAVSVGRPGKLGRQLIALQLRRALYC
jgi:hypothetical protein